MKRSRLKRGQPLKRKTRLSRGEARLERRTRLAPVNRERKAKEWARAYGSEERVQWIQQRPSVASGRTPCENAHVPEPEGPSGMGRKADARWIVPLTTVEHQRLHDHGPRTFEEVHGIDLTEEARRTEAAWQAHQRKEN